MTVDWKITQKQAQFIRADTGEVLFGGAAGGGKSYGQIVDAFLYRHRYPGSKQIIFRRTYSELERSIIRTAQRLYPRSRWRYNSSVHTGVFRNGSVLDFGYCDNESDVYKYQSAEYDVIRFDELTHFTKTMYEYLTSRLRGANDFPKRMKSSTNPGGVGHAWVKERFIDPAPPMTEYIPQTGMKRIFIPSKVYDNKFLMEKNPQYIQQLMALGEKDKKALLYGEWDIFEGQYFDEWDSGLHVCKPFVIPDYWTKYVAFDYGLDMLAAYEIAVDERGKAYFFKEFCRPNLIISRAAAQIIRMVNGDKIEAYFAPPDLWNRRQDSGKSVAEIFSESGILLTKVSNDRVTGWYNVKEYLHPVMTEAGKDSMLAVFENCRALIKCLPQLQHSAVNPNDVATEPHDITHAPDAVRYFVSGRPMAAKYHSRPADDEVVGYDEQIEAFINF